MSLSNEERYEKALYTLKSLREHLKNNWREDWEGTVRMLDDSTRQLTGMILSRFDSSGVYWLFGENEDGFKGYSSSYFYPETKEDAESNKRMSELKYPFDTQKFAEECGFRSDIVLLGKWWDLYRYVPALLYPIKRYEDDAFTKEFKEEFNRLISYIVDLKPNCEEQEEKVLLLKHTMFVREMTAGDYLLNCPDYIVQAECAKKYRDMTQDELGTLAKADRDKYATRIKEDDKLKTDPLYGAVVTKTITFVEKEQAV